jgi:8-amino-7-oxononanoate synthase
MFCWELVVGRGMIPWHGDGLSRRVGRNGSWQDDRPAGVALGSRLQKYSCAVTKMIHMETVDPSHETTIFVAKSWFLPESELVVYSPSSIIKIYIYMGDWMEAEMQRRLQQRRQRGTLRRLVAPDRSSVAADFSSNDYLGLARDGAQFQRVEAVLREEYRGAEEIWLGATGSRLLSGDAPWLHQVEAAVCDYQEAKCALLCNSGYDANLSLVSTFPGTCILYDAYIHNSLHMGLRWWQSRDAGDDRRKDSAPFAHNNVSDLQRLLEEYTNNERGHQHIAILIESIYSMDGDMAPVRAILNLAQDYQAVVLVDEAHGWGIFGAQGTGVLAAEHCTRHPALAAVVYTFGKAAGCHGAVICAPHSPTLKEYLINYANPVIYSTALPLHSILTIRCAYETVVGPKGARLRQQLQRLVTRFRTQLTRVLEQLQAGIDLDSATSFPYRLLPSSSPIQALIVPGNEACMQFCRRMFEIRQIRLFPIRAPTVPQGQERIRIVIHAHNTEEEIDRLIAGMEQTLQEEIVTAFLFRTRQHAKL